VKLLAELWKSAWKAGGGNDIPDSKLVTLDEGDLEGVYRNRDFAPSLSLAAMVKSKRFEPKATGTTARRSSPSKANGGNRSAPARRRAGRRKR
jgi:hypothetical protein